MNKSRNTQNRFNKKDNTKLIEKMKKIQTNKQTEPESTLSQSDKQYKKLLNKNIRLKNDNTKLSNKLDKLSRQLINETENNSMKNKEINSLQKKNLSQANEISELKIHILDLENKLRDKKKEIEHMIKEDSYKRIAELEANNNSLEREYQAVSKKNKELQLDLGRTREDSKVSKKEINKITQPLKEQNNTLQKENNKLKIHNTRLMERYLDSIPPSKMLEYLMSMMTLSNIYEYEKVPLLSNQYRKNIKYMHKKKISTTSRPIENFSSDVIYGHLVRKNNEWAFLDLENNVYTIEHSKTKHLQEDTPYKAKKTEGESVILLFRYKNTEVIEETIKESPPPKIEKESEDTNYINDSVNPYQYLGDFSVLLVTNKNGSRYVNFLKGLVGKVTWLDPFEKSPTHIKNSSISHDVVIVCKDATSHVVSNIIEEDSAIKYQYLMQHNENLIYTRVRFTAIQLGLLG